MTSNDDGTRWLSLVAATEPQDGARGAGRDEILTAASELFLARGYNRTTMDDVAARLGCSRRHIQHYFRSKGELYLGIHRRTLGRAHAAVRPIVESNLPPSQKLREMARAHVRLMLSEHTDMRVAVRHSELWAAAEGNVPGKVLAAILKLREEFGQYYVSVIAAGVRSGEFRAVDPEVAAKACLGCFNYIGTWTDTDVAGASADEIAEQFADFVCSSLTFVFRENVRDRDGTA